MTKEEIKGIGLVVWQLTSRECHTDEADSQAFCSCFWSMVFIRAYFHQDCWGIVREGDYCLNLIYISASALLIFTVLAQEQNDIIRSKKLIHVKYIYIDIFFFFRQSNKSCVVLPLLLFLCLPSFSTPDSQEVLQTAGSRSVLSDTEV